MTPLLCPSFQSRPKRTILILGEFTFSRGEAASNYVIGLGNAFGRAGFEVQYLSGYPNTAVIRDDFQPYACHVVPDERLRRGWKHVWSRVSASGNKILQWLEQSNAGGYYAVIAYPEARYTVGFLLRLQNLCHKKAWKLMVVVVEWFGFNRSGGLADRLLTFLDSEVQLRFVNKRINHIIAVSSFLERYYRKAGCDVIFIPPLIDAQAEKWNCQPTTEAPKSDLTLLFSGSWSRERLDIIMEAVKSLRRDGNRIALEFLGSELKDLEKNPILQRQFSQAQQGVFRFHGRVPVNKVLSITATADFGILLRDRATWSDACFPSKVAEFQALGVPILCNLTSDLGAVLRDGENALIVPHVTVEALVATIKRALALIPSERARLRQASLQRAATHFDYRNYVGRLSEFVDRI